MAKSEVDYLKELVAFPSVTANKKASKECAEHCASFFKNHGLHTEIIKSGGYPNVIATSQKTKTPKVLLQAHMDVVPAKAEMFKMKIEGDKWLGRGVFDMKFACASYMKLLDELGKDIDKYDFGIMLTFDEEIGGHNGVEALLDKGYSSDICILPDSGKDWCLQATGNGAWFLKLSKTGKNAHGSLPHTGVNAAEILIQAINELQALREKYPTDELTLSVTKLSSGTAMNQIPDYAETTVDIRFKSEEVFEDLKSRINKLCATHRIEMNDIELFACVNVDIKKPLIIDFLSIAEEVVGRKIATSHSAGSTDARYFCAKNIPAIVIQPNGGGRHSDDEWVDAEGVKQLTRVLYKFVTKYAII